ncbi:hypothetical protein K1T71_002578 [Dendrolimus kikuchii]|uniref:Uncharacterized protein n=1 Tax=Dendrolimus kikuchii TaxID=765133 RepID=A0ACC1DDD8_9NEOP|nr:hypothetical protein K1T71_002578 [Dendrolimus kikuchii]
MGINATEFEMLERQILETIGEFRTATSLEVSLREVLRNECARAEAAEAARDAAERALIETRNDATVASASATQAASAIAIAQDQLTGLKIQLELSDRQKTILEEKCAAMSGQINSLEEELFKLRPLQLAQSNLQRQYVELQERVTTATEEARKEATRLESEIRRVEKCAAGGSEIRERARLAAAAHARERRLAAAELQHTTRELQATNVELIRVSALVTEQQHRLKQYECNNAVDTKDNFDTETITELRSALEAERADAAKLERALATALADNSALAASLHSADNSSSIIPTTTPPTSIASTNICQIDLFLAD